MVYKVLCFWLQNALFQICPGQKSENKRLRCEKVKATTAAYQKQRDSTSPSQTFDIRLRVVELVNTEGYSRFVLPQVNS
jgi:hypothetical protein